MWYCTSTLSPDNMSWQLAFLVDASIMHRTRPPCAYIAESQIQCADCLQHNRCKRFAINVTLGKFNSRFNRNMATINQSKTAAEATFTSQVLNFNFWGPLNVLACHFYDELTALLEQVIYYSFCLGLIIDARPWYTRRVITSKYNCKLCRIYWLIQTTNLCINTFELLPARTNTF